MNTSILLILMAISSHSLAMYDQESLIARQMEHNDLFLAFQKRDVQAVERFIKKTEDISQPICYLDPNHSYECFKFKSLLELAVEHDMPSAIILLRARANAKNVEIDQPDDEGNNVLARAVLRTSLQGETLEALISHQLVNKQNNAGRTPLHTLFTQPQDPKTNKIRINCLNLARLCKQGASLDIQDCLGNTPIHYALARDQQGFTLDIMLENVALDEETVPLCVNTQNEQGTTPLHIAIASYSQAGDLQPKEEARYLQTIEHLLRQGANLDVPNKSGTTALDLIKSCIDVGDDRSEKFKQFLLDYTKNDAISPEERAHRITGVTNQTKEKKTEKTTELNWIEGLVEDVVCFLSSHK